MIEYVFIYTDSVGNRFKLFYHTKARAKAAYRLYKGLMITKEISPRIRRVRRKLIGAAKAYRERIVNMTIGSTVYIEDLP